MDFLIALGALVFLMFVAYRGFSVIMFAPVAALGAVLADRSGRGPRHVQRRFHGEHGRVRQKLLSRVSAGRHFRQGHRALGLFEIDRFRRHRHCRPRTRHAGDRAGRRSLTYGGVSLFVVVFAIYPFAVEMFRQSDIPKRLIPGTIALGAFTFTMDSLPGTPQIQNIIPTTYFKTNTFAAPWLGIIGAAFILVTGLAYLEWRRRSALAAGEGYGTGHMNEPEVMEHEELASPYIAILPLIVVGVLNKVFTQLIGAYYGATYELQLAAMAKPITVAVDKVAAVWAVQGALLAGIITVFIFAFPRVSAKFAEGSKAAVAGALLASINTASEYGFGAVIAALPGFIVIREALRAIPNPLINEAITVTALAGITGSASGGCRLLLPPCRTSLSLRQTLQTFRSRCCIALRPWRPAAWTRCLTMAP